MDVEKLLQAYKDGEQECWQYTDYIKHNPVLYPRVGDVFLKELFALANVERKIPYSRRKKVQMDTVWYSVSAKTIAVFLRGCEIAKQKSLDVDIALDNGGSIPFYAYWYMTCLFLDEAEKLAAKQLSDETILRLKKEKQQKGICRPDCRKYYKCIGFYPVNTASDLPISKNFCPMELEYSCKKKCPVSIKVGEERLQRGTLGFRSKEELLYLYTVRTGHLPKGVLAGELLWEFLAKEYQQFYELLLAEDMDKAKAAEFNCQLFTVFAYMVDALNTYSWLEIKEHAMGTYLEEELKEHSLWQLLDVLHAKPALKENPLAWLLIEAQKKEQV